jgi:hypothetical protein
MKTKPNRRRLHAIVRVKDLPNDSSEGLVLVCNECGTEASAEPYDYDLLDPDEVFACCSKPMRLVKKVVRYEDV